MEQVEVFDITLCVDGKLDFELGSRIAECFHQTGCAIVKDPRVNATDNDHFLDLMERYFSQPSLAKEADTLPKYHYQVGFTPPGTEIPEATYNANVIRKLENFSEENRPQIPTGPDPKCRYMWRIGPRPEKTRFSELNAEPAIPKSFPEWESTLNNWGNKLISTVYLVADLLSLGLGIESVAKKMEYGPHLLAPTGIDLATYHELNTCIAGYHSDLNLLTIHGRSRYPGLFVWLRNGKRIPVRLPEGCLLLQAGQQLERLTGGYITAGMHEVVVSKETQQVLKQAEEMEKCTWRVSSTLFGHLASDEILEPLRKFKNPQTENLYPSILAGDFVAQYLKKINLHNKT